MSDLEQRIREIDLICIDLHDRLIAIDAIDDSVGASLASSLHRMFDRILDKPEGSVTSQRTSTIDH